MEAPPAGLASAHGYANTLIFSARFGHQSGSSPCGSKQLLNRSKKAGFYQNTLAWLVLAQRRCWCRRKTTAPVPTAMTTTSWAPQTAPPAPCTGRGAGVEALQRGGLRRWPMRAQRGKALEHMGCDVSAQPSLVRAPGASAPASMNRLTVALGAWPTERTTGITSAASICQP